MIRRTLAAVALLMLAAPLHAGFNEIARAVQSKHGVKRIWIPFLGIARAAIWMARPAGVHDFQLATFEGTDDVDPREMGRLMRERAGEGFQPLVQVRSTRSGEWAYIYAKPGKSGKRVDLLILTHDHDDTVLVRVEVDADELVKQMDDPRGVVRIAHN